MLTIFKFRRRGRTRVKFRREAMLKKKTDEERRKKSQKKRKDKWGKGRKATEREKEVKTEGYS